MSVGWQVYARKEDVIEKKAGMTSNYAAAYAVKAVDVDVIVAYPITPQTTIVERLAEFVANGELNAEYIPVESEHSALSAAIGAAAVGARVFTATCSQGLEYMHEILHIASGLRLPMVMAIPGRALSAPLSIHGDYQDLMNVRDTGWIIFIASTAQEVYDSIIMAYRISEDSRILLPVIVAYDGFLMSHTIEPIVLYKEDVIRKFTPRNPSRPRLDPKEPITMGVMALPDWYYEIKYQVVHTLRESKPVIKEIQAEFNKAFGASYDVIEKFMTDDADYVIVTYGGAAYHNAVEAAKHMRKEGIRAGVLRLRLYRPFPTDEIVEALRDVKAIAVIDRAFTPGAPLEGPVALDVVAAFKSQGIDKPIISVIHGISQRTMYVRDFYELFKKMREWHLSNAYPRKTLYLGLRE